MAVERGANIIGLQELFNLHWFPFDINEKNFSLAEREDGKTIKTMQALAKEKEIVLICPIFEQDISGVYYNSAIVIDADGSIAGKYRKTHIPELPYWEEKYYFKPGNLGFPVFTSSSNELPIIGAHPSRMGGPQVEAFLSQLAAERQRSTSDPACAGESPGITNF